MAVAAGACAHRQAATVPRAGSLAESRARGEWIHARLRELREAEGARGTERERLDELRRELEAAGVDWRSFMGPVRGSTHGSWQITSEGPKNHTLRQLGQKLNLVRSFRQIFGIRDPAEDLARDGRVLDSAFFTNRDVSTLTPADVLEDLLAQAPQGRISLLESKTEGTSEGFIGRDARGVRYIFVFDPPDYPELSTAAEVIGSTIVRLAGYNVPYPGIVTLAELDLDPDAEDGLGVEDVERFRGRRAAATRMIAEGFQGSWTYWVFRDRRPLRALRLFGAWLNNTDQVDHNTLAELFDEKADLVRYYVIDFSGSLGASSARVKDPHDGYVNNKFDLERGLTWPLRLLASPFGYRDPWDANQPIVSPAVGRFEAELEPRLWKPYYPNLAYEDMDEEDARWAAEIIGEFSDELIDAVVELARYSRPEDASYVAETLKRRRDIVVGTYLARD